MLQGYTGESRIFHRQTVLSSKQAIIVEKNNEKGDIGFGGQVAKAQELAVRLMRVKDLSHSSMMLLPVAIETIQLGTTCHRKGALNVRNWGPYLHVHKKYTAGAAAIWPHWPPLNGMSAGTHCACSVWESRAGN